MSISQEDLRHHLVQAAAQIFSLKGLIMTKRSEVTEPRQPMRELLPGVRASIQHCPCQTSEQHCTLFELQHCAAAEVLN